MEGEGEGGVERETSQCWTRPGGAKVPAGPNVGRSIIGGALWEGGVNWAVATAWVST